MGIPYARQYTATMTGAVLKTAKCESCQTEFVYLAGRQGRWFGTEPLVPRCLSS